MKAGDVQRETLIACFLLAGFAVFAGEVTNQLLPGMTVAAGLLLGSVNAFVFPAMFERGATGMVAALMRLGVFTSIAVVVAFVMAAPMWAIALGIAAAQMIMVVVGVRRGLRA